jgi:hypothetical protein
MYCNKIETLDKINKIQYKSVINLSNKTNEIPGIMLFMLTLAYVISRIILTCCSISIW